MTESSAYGAIFRQVVLDRASGLNSTIAVPRLSMAEWEALADGSATIDQLALFLTSRFKGELHSLRMRLRINGKGLPS